MKSHALLLRFGEQLKQHPSCPQNVSKCLEIAPKYLDWDFCQFSVVLHKIRHDCIMKLHGPSPQITKKTKHGNLYNDRSTLKNAKNGNQKHDFLTIFWYNFVNSLLCCIKFSIIVQRSYINVPTKQLRKQSTETYITTSQTSKNRVFENYFSPLIDRCIRSHALFS